MLDAHLAVPTCAIRTPESSALPQAPNGKSRGNRGPTVWMQHDRDNFAHGKRLEWARTLIRMSGGWLPKRIVFGNLEGTVRSGWGEKEKEWADCVQSDVRAFGMARDGKATAGRVVG